MKHEMKPMNYESRGKVRAAVPRTLLPHLITGVMKVMTVTKTKMLVGVGAVLLAVLLTAGFMTFAVRIYSNQAARAEIVWSEFEDVKCLRIDAPPGYHIIKFKVEPESAIELRQHVLRVGGGSGQPPEALARTQTSLYEFEFESERNSHVRSFPNSGTLDIPLEQAVKFTDNPIPSFEHAKQFSEDERRQIREYCGTYVLVTKDPRYAGNFMTAVQNDFVEKWMVAGGPQPTFAWWLKKTTAEGRATAAEIDDGDELMLVVPNTKAAKKVAPAKRDHPLPIHGQADPQAKGFLIVFKSNVDVKAEVERLEKLHGFKHKFVLKAIKAFAAEMSDAAIEQLRWEPSIERIEHDSEVTIQGGGGVEIK